jgi:DNA-directed RNA polymerase subunit RPC12/RpoP
MITMNKFTETKSDKLAGAGKGLANGLAAGSGMIMIGALLCCTVIGAIVGIPMIIIGLFGSAIGPLMGLANIKGSCPYCGTNVSASAGLPGIDCRGCKKRIVIRNKKFFAVE